MYIYVYTYVFIYVYVYICRVQKGRRKSALVARMQQAFCTSSQSERGVVGMCVGHGGRCGCLILSRLCRPHSYHPFDLSTFICFLSSSVLNDDNPIYTFVMYILHDRFSACFELIQFKYYVRRAHTPKKRGVFYTCTYRCMESAFLDPASGLFCSLFCVS